MSDKSDIYQFINSYIRKRQGARYCQSNVAFLVYKWLYGNVKEQYITSQM